jgi:heterodisulfide reductase subunit B
MSHKGEDTAGEKMRIPYYPGCTLSTTAKNFEKTAMSAAEVLGFTMVEIEDWNCCGASFPLTEDNIMGLAGPTNVLIDAKKECLKEENEDKVVTLCSVCFNVLRRTNYAFKEKGDKLDTVNFMLEKDYAADTNVYHYLEVLRDDIGYDVIKEKVKRELKGLKVAPYYGCFLLRPQDEVGFDDQYAPTIFEDFLSTLGCEVVDFSHKSECCGSYSAMSSPENVEDCAYNVVDAAAAAGAEILVTACPLCQFNLDEKQEIIKSHHSDATEIPVVYFTQLLGLALGMDIKDFKLDENRVNPLPLIQAKGLV